MTATYEIRLGAPTDTPLIAELMLEAGGGLFEHLLDGVVPGADTADLIALAINDESSSYHFGNAYLAETEGIMCGLALCFPAEESGLPDIAMQVVPADRLEPVREILESRIDGSLYLNSLAVRPGYERRGIARMLLDTTARIAALDGYDTMSLHVWSDNIPAMHLYRSLGFETRRLIEVLPCARLRYRGPVALVAAEIDALIARIDGKA